MLLDKLDRYLEYFNGSINNIIQSYINNNTYKLYINTTNNESKNIFYVNLKLRRLTLSIKVHNRLMFSQMLFQR